MHRPYCWFCHEVAHFLAIITQGVMRVLTGNHSEFCKTTVNFTKGRLLSYAMELPMAKIFKTALSVHDALKL